MMFSATSFTECRSSDGSTCRGTVPLIGLDVTVSPRRRRNSSGDSDATAPHVAGDERGTRGRGSGDGVGEEVDGRSRHVAAHRSGELRADARLVHLARGDRIKACQHPGAMGVAVGVAPFDAALRPVARGRGSARASHDGIALAGKAFVQPDAGAVLPQHEVSPAAGGFGNARPPAVRARVRIRQVADPSAADRGAIGLGAAELRKRRGQRRVPPSAAARSPRASRTTRRSARRGGRGPARAAASATAAQHRRGAAQLAEPLDPHRASLTRRASRRKASG